MKMFLYHFTVAFSIFSCFSGYNCSKNIALNRPAESDSAYSSSWGPNKAVDGITNQNVYCDSCLHTRGDGSTAFLKINFQNVSSINRVEIFYRRPYKGSVCSQTSGGGIQSNNRFKGYRIEIEGITCYQDTSEPYPELYQNNSCKGSGSYLRIVQVNSSPDDNNPLLEICEAIVHGCPTKKYGTDCSQDCPINCLNGTCDPDTGDCWNGCKPGWQGNRCQDACSSQTFGLKCSATCRCYNDANCNHINGSCPNGLCDTGWEGESCQEVCPDYYYGDNCTQNCHNCKNNEICHHINGTCPDGCMDGYTGDKCDTVCPNQTFGLKCMETCRCFNNANCNHINGSCPDGICDKGWIGESCQEACPDYYYGYNCNETCHNCKSNVTCHHVNGTCPDGCMDGYTSDKCDEKCPVGSYGSECSSTCYNYCFKDLCRNTDGECQKGCERGYKGTFCKTACDDGTYGYNCNTTCGNCRNNATCDKVSGSCPGNDCENGFKGTLCTDQCSENEYGQNCIEQCGICRDGVTCDAVNGNCTNGCSVGYSGARCQSVCSKGLYGDNCSTSCTSNCIDTCDHISGLCLKGCIDGYMGDFCTEVISDSNTGIIAGVVIASLIALIIVIIVVIVLKRRRNNKYRENTSNRYVNTGIKGKTNQYDSQTMNFSNLSGKDRSEIDADDGETFDDDENNGETYVNVASVKLGITEMTVDQLRHCISEKQSHGTLSTEYTQLIRGAVHPHEIGKDPKNKSKNRFLTTFPYDHSLVSLSNGNYINANYIDDVEVKNTYIASQGPKKNTLEDFWRMIWENGTGKIVMLANLVELGKNKCEQYWPKGEKDKLSIGIYEVIMQKEKFYGAYNIRELLLKCLETKEQRKVVQFHFTTWPDHGTADAMQLAIFQHVIESEATQNTGPMVVHCSAGIGRTGTYIALNAMTKWIRNHSKVDVYSFVSSMRNNRMNMIQTAEQYIVLHEALLEAQLMTNSAIKREDFSKVWTNLSMSDYPKNEGRCRKEFQKLKLALSNVDDDSMKDALSNQNKSKNRDQNIIPIRIYRPFLTSNLVKRTNYINAVALPSMRAGMGMIATQYPTPDTVQDFYSLIYDHDSPTIVILEPNEEIVSLFPENKQSSVFGVVSVSQKHEVSGKDFNERKLELKKKDVHETKQVDVIECTSWPWRQTLPSSPSVVLSLIQRLSQTMQSSHPIIVVCYNGATKCGLFCSLFNVLESLSDGGEVDILRYVRQLQIRRPEFISESAQYEFLYDAVNDHLEQANIYANV